MYRIFAINPGSTSTKIALFNGEDCLFSANVNHDEETLRCSISDQLPLRRDTILALLRDSDVSLEQVDAFVGRGGGLVSVLGGVYAVDALLLEHARIGANGISHPAQLGSMLAHEFAAQYGKPSFVVNPPDTDEMCDEARLTGIKGVYRQMHLHALNLKETAIRHANSIGRRYEDCNFVVCHIGGGISVSAHRRGRMIDGNDIVGGEGPMAPTRCGGIPVMKVLEYLKDHAPSDMKNLCMKTGGFTSLLGTSDARDVEVRAEAGDEQAKRVWDAMVYQIIFWIGAMAAVLHGNVDGILLGGGMVKSKTLVRSISESCAWIAQVTAYPGEFEMEAMASGAIRALKGEEATLTYTGAPVWQAFII